jgi:hypothetical protein
MTTANRYSAAQFNGSELDALRALEAHESTLIIGSRVRAYRGSDVSGYITGYDGGRRYEIIDDDGVMWFVESSRLELV